MKFSDPIVLASCSPRRKEILEMVGLDFEVLPSKYVEPNHSDHLKNPQEFAEEVAIGKGEEVFKRLHGERCVLSADTIGILGELVLEKPKDRADAKRMLDQMSGQKHIVLTAVALFIPGKGDPLVKSVKTEVFFRNLTNEEIETYLNETEYLDKAAAYAIQGKASIFVEKIIGDYFNIVGLPIETVWRMLGEAEKTARNGSNENE